MSAKFVKVEYNSKIFGRYIPVVPYALMQISQIIKENNLNN